MNNRTDLSEPERRETAACITGPASLDCGLVGAPLDFGEARIETSTEDIDVETFVRDAFESFRRAAEKRNIGMAAHIGAGLPVLRTDRRLLDLTLEILFDQALVFTPSGGEFELGACADGAGVKIWLRNAVGTNVADEVGRLFDPSDAGLELGLCKRFVGTLGGRIDVESEVGKRSTFTVSLPCQPDEERISYEPGQIRAGDKSRLRGLRRAADQKRREQL